MSVLYYPSTWPGMLDALCGKWPLRSVDIYIEQPCVLHGVDVVTVAGTILEGTKPIKLQVIYGNPHGDVLTGVIAFMYLLGRLHQLVEDDDDIEGHLTVDAVRKMIREQADFLRDECDCNLVAAHLVVLEHLATPWMQAIAADGRAHHHFKSSDVRALIMARANQKPPADPMRPKIVVKEPPLQFGTRIFGGSRSRGRYEN